MGRQTYVLNRVAWYLVHSTPGLSLWSGLLVWSGAWCTGLAWCTGHPVTGLGFITQGGTLLFHSFFHPQSHQNNYISFQFNNIVCFIIVIDKKFYGLTCFQLKQKVEEKSACSAMLYSHRIVLHLRTSITDSQLGATITSLSHLVS